jgi:formate dehydrogenase major subunit
MPTTAPHRRDFLRRSVGGFSLGGLLSLGFDLRAAQAETSHSKIFEIRPVPSVCPYCAVGCGQHIHVRDNKIVNIEGNPDSPISKGTLCPKGAATFQLAVNENRLTHVWYRARRAKEWDKTKSLSWAMKRIAELVVKTRNATFKATATHDPAGKPLRDKDPATGKHPEVTVNHTLAIGSLGGATMDNEWNYVQTKLLRALGVVGIENQARI